MKIEIEIYRKKGELCIGVPYVERSAPDPPHRRVPTLKMPENTKSTISKKEAEGGLVNIFDKNDGYIVIYLDEVNSLIKSLQELKKKYIEK